MPKPTRTTGFFSALLLTATAGICTAQTATTPENIPFEKKWLKSGKSEMACFVLNGGRQIDIGTFAIDIQLNSEHLSIYTTLHLAGNNGQRIDTSIADARTFKPLYRSSFDKSKEVLLKYGKEVTGYYYEKQGAKRTKVKEPINESFLDSYCYPYLLGLLPLSSGYSVSMPVYDYRPENNQHISKAVVQEVKSNMYVSKLTGAHKVWQVSVFEEATNDKYIYYLDKETRRMWKVDIFSKGQQLLMVDKEIDFNPFKSTFDKVATLKLLNEGTAVITGQAFARDNENEGMLSGMAVLNVNKKQFAPAGVSIVLIPYTDFFKEWLKLNESSRKKGISIPLPQEVAECIKVTTVYDDKGHFEFVNLMPGDYLLYTEFGYKHTSKRTEVVGYTDTYINGLFQGTSTNTVSNSYNVNASASVKKVVSIDKAGEKVEVKLKKTL
ncbi:DUF3108 domain-containing protein [Chitinophaga nivalis]|nr:hypothetical protein [Chitinophaga nivalis]MCW3465937.1 hypothetical protein [Chitinophaga nivalis]